MLALWAEVSGIRAGALLIEAAGGFLLTAYCITAFVALIWRLDRLRARQLVGEGALNALSFMVCATLLKTLFLTSRSQIGVFASVLFLRTILKRVFAAEIQ
ncbi:MAG: DUF1622 domain-containing protein [Chthoniobacterales bacterium]|nr:DUF1622 domain-containing protein [Chthoniobacterales bacterium]